MTGKTTAEAPSLIELKGHCDSRGTYEVRLFVFGGVTARHVRNVIKQLELQAAFLEEDEPVRGQSA